MSDDLTNVTKEEEEQPRGLFARMKAGISRNVIVLGLVAFFTDASSEMIIPIRILFLVLVLQTPLPIAGFIEGVAESTASLLKIWAGHLSNRASRRTPLINIGYNLSNFVKPLLAFVTAWPAALGLIFLDRVGKGFRGSPRDAMMADSTEPRYMGKAFGFHRSMDTFGAAVGPVACYLILLLTAGDIRAVLAWTIVPGVLALLVLVLFLREKPAKTAAEKEAKVEALADEAKQEKVRISPKQFGAAFWMFTAISGIFAIGNSSDAFIFLRTADLETSVIAVPLIYFVYNIVYAILATPLGALSDRFGRLPILMLGYASFALVYVGWASATQGWQAWALFSLYGVYAAATEGVAKAFVADLIPKSVRGSAMGWFNGVIGFAALPANVLGGWLWSVAGAPSTFVFGAWMSLFALGLMIVWLPWLRRRKVAAERALASAQA
jgi:MFS family permease